nr:hypothetical protein BaRGS_004124 [Batillaria attramentaria]
MEVRQQAVRWQLRALAISVLLLWLFNSSIAHTNPPLITIMLGFVKLGLVVVVAAMVWLSVVVKTSEANGLIATKRDLEWLLMQTKKKED